MDPKISCPELRREITIRPEMLTLPMNTIVGKTFCSDGECWLYWKGEASVESKLFDSEKEMNKFVVDRKLSSHLCCINILP